MVSDVSPATLEKAMNHTASELCGNDWYWAYTFLARIRHEVPEVYQDLQAAVKDRCSQCDHEAQPGIFKLQNAIGHISHMYDTQPEKLQEWFDYLKAHQGDGPDIAGQYPEVPEDPEDPPLLEPVVFFFDKAPEGYYWP